MIRRVNLTMMGPILGHWRSKYFPRIWDKLSVKSQEITEGQSPEAVCSHLNCLQHPAAVLASDLDLAHLTLPSPGRSPGSPLGLKPSLISHCFQDKDKILPTASKAARLRPGVPLQTHLHASLAELGYFTHAISSNLHQRLGTCLVSPMFRWGILTWSSKRFWEVAKVMELPILLSGMSKPVWFWAL